MVLTTRPTFVSLGVIVRVSLAIKRYNEHGKSYKGKNLIGAGLKVQRFRPLPPR